MKVKTTESEQIWQSPDGQKKIYAVTLKDESDTEYRLKTYSEAISSTTFEGEVESYVAKNGDRFVKQPQAEGGYRGGGGGNSAARLAADATKQKEIRAEWAIGQAIKSSGLFPLDDEALKKIEAVAVKLNAMVDTVIAGTA